MILMQRNKLNIFPGSRYFVVYFCVSVQTLMLSANLRHNKINVISKAQLQK